MVKRDYRVKRKSSAFNRCIGNTLLAATYKNKKQWQGEFEKAAKKCNVIPKKKVKRYRKYKVTPGRVIICKDTGKEIFSIKKQEGFSPTEADAMTHYIVNILNKKKDFSSFYKKYMK